MMKLIFLFSIVSIVLAASRAAPNRKHHTKRDGATPGDQPFEAAPSEPNQESPPVSQTHEKKHGVHHRQHLKRDSSSGSNDTSTSEPQTTPYSTSSPIFEPILPLGLEGHHEKKHNIHKRYHSKRDASSGSNDTSIDDAQPNLNSSLPNVLEPGLRWIGPNEKKHSIHKRGHLKRDASSGGDDGTANGTDTNLNPSWPTLFPPGLPQFEKKRGAHKRYHLKRDASTGGNGTQANSNPGGPTIYEPVVPLLNEVNNDSQEVNPFSVTIGLSIKKHGEHNKSHHGKRDAGENIPDRTADGIPEDNGQPDQSNPDQPKPDQYQEPPQPPKDTVDQSPQ